VRYEVVGLLGRGGAAVVELAVGRDGRWVATKRVPFAGSAAQINVARRRLLREAEIVGKLHHPGIVPILDVLEEDGDILLVFPAMAENLQERVERLGPLPPVEVARVGQALLAALAVAHRHGIVHRDIKPSNVLFDEAGRPALSDFGVAVTWDLTGGLTPSGTVVGTPMWMAPEQARGEPPGPASDVFSLGATLAYALTEHSPYGSGSPEVMMVKAVRGDLSPLPTSIPDALRVPLALMLDPRPERRPSAAAALGGLDGTREAPVLQPARPSLPGIFRRRLDSWPARVLGDPPPRPKARRRLGVAALFLAGVGVAAGSLGAVGLARHRPPPPPAPHTIGKACAPGWYDLDRVAANGCESRSDYVAGTILTPKVPIHANVVPLSTVDSFMTHVSGNTLNFCWGSLHVTLAAPPQTAEQLTVWNGTRQVGQAVSAGGDPATVTVNKPSCFGSDSEDLRVAVSAVASTGGSSAGDFTLTRDAGW
jgi:eukaryotic-like serine/threonine-protein kinase